MQTDSDSDQTSDIRPRAHLWLLVETERAPADSGRTSLSLDLDSESVVDTASFT